MSAGAPVHAHALTAGGILQLIESEGHFSGPLAPPPTLQIINIRRVPANALTDVYWVRPRRASSRRAPALPVLLLTRRRRPPSPGGPIGWR